MMAKTEDHPQDRPATLKAMALSAVLAVAAIFALGIVAGVAGAVLDDGEANWVIAAILVAIALLVIGGAAWGLVRLRPWAGTGEPVSPRTRKANNLLLLSGLVGGLAAGALALGTVGRDDPFALFSNSPIPPMVVLPAIAVWLLAIAISLQWHRSVDEHEAESYEFGGLAGLYVYAAVVPAWWLAWRGGLVAAPDSMAIYLGVMAVWCAGWFWRRYR